MKNRYGALAAPFPYFGGKSGAAKIVWDLFDGIDNYVEPFAGSAAVLLAREDPVSVETVNDKDGFICNFWRAVKLDPVSVAAWANDPVNEIDLFARHLWLVNESEKLVLSLEANPDFFDAKIAGWWVWGACAWIGDGWCNGRGPYGIVDGAITDWRDGNRGRGVNRQMPHLSNRGQGVNRQMPHLGNRGQGIAEWFSLLQFRLRDVRVLCGDWRRALGDAVTTRHGLTGVFLDPPYTKGAMQYAAGGAGGEVADAVRAWCLENGDDQLLRIILCGHAGEHDALLAAGWVTKKWDARKGYASTEIGMANTKSETLWLSPSLAAAENFKTLDLFECLQ